MKNSFSPASASSILVLAGPASAADLSPGRRRPTGAPPPAVVYNWTGCYIGGNVGGGWARTEQLQIAKVGGHCDRSGERLRRQRRNHDFIGGGQIGCDYQVRDTSYSASGRGSTSAT